MIELEAQAIPAMSRPTRLGAAWLRPGQWLESDRAGWVLCATGVVVLALSVAAALVSDPAAAGPTLLTAAGVAASLVVALGHRCGSRCPLPSPGLRSSG